MHNTPHTPEARAKMSAARMGKPSPKLRRPVAIGGIDHFTCPTCKELKPRGCFYADKGHPLGIRSQCKVCHTASSLRTRDPDNARRLKRLSEAARRARAAKAPGRVSSADLELLARILGTACLKCGTYKNPTVDHVVPLRRGGWHHPVNLQPLCRHCNEKKQARTADYRTPEQLAAVEAGWVVEFKRIPEETRRAAP